jgi:hypothetical protein
MSKVYIVEVEGWGESEDEFYNMGTYSTRAKAEAKVEKLLTEWEEDGNDRDDVVWQIDEMELDG